MGIEEVDRKNEPDGQNGFFSVDEQRNVQPGTGDETREEGRKPHGIPGETDNRHAPEDGPVVDFIPISITVELGLGASPEEPLDLRNKVGDVLQVRNHGTGTPQKAVFLLCNDAVDQIRYMDQERNSQHYSAEQVEEENG